MEISAAPLIYILIFVAVIALVEGLYLTIFGKSISLNNRMSRRLALMEKTKSREGVLEQLRKEMSQHANARGIPLYSILATKAQKANIAFSPQQLLMIMVGVCIFAYLGLTLGTSAATPVRVVLHPEVSISVTVNVARSLEEATKQARGEAIARDGDEADEEADDMLDPSVAPQPDI